MRSLLSKKAVFFISIAAIVLIAGSAHASLMLRQPSLKLTLKQGQSFDGGIVLENISGKPLKVKAEFVDTIGKDGKAVPRSCSKWMDIADNEFVMPPHSIKDLRVNIRVPKGVSGGYWTAIVYSYYDGQMKGPEDMTFNIKMHIEMPVNIQIADTVKNDISADDIELACSADKTLTAKATVKNTGNSFTETKLMLVVFGPDGKASEKFNSREFKIYPDEEKTVSYSKKVELKKGTYKAVFMLAFGDEGLKTIEKEFVVD